MTPICRRKFNLHGEIQLTHGDYPKATIALGDKLNVPVIDLELNSKRLFESLGSEGTKKLFMYCNPGQWPNYPEGIADNTHLQLAGAIAMAKLIIQGIQKLNLSLAKYTVLF